MSSSEHQNVFAINFDTPATNGIMPVSTADMARSIIQSFLSNPPANAKKAELLLRRQLRPVSASKQAQVLLDMKVELSRYKDLARSLGAAIRPELDRIRRRDKLIGELTELWGEEDFIPTQYRPQLPSNELLRALHALTKAARNKGVPLARLWEGGEHGGIIPSYIKKTHRSQRRTYVTVHNIKNAMSEFGDVVPPPESEHGRGEAASDDRSRAFSDSLLNPSLSDEDDEQESHDISPPITLATTAQPIELSFSDMRHGDTSSTASAQLAKFEEDENSSNSEHPEELTPDDSSFSFPVSSASDTSSLCAGQRLNDAVIQRCLDSYNTSSRRIYDPLYLQVYEQSPVSSIPKPLDPEVQQLVFPIHHPHEKHWSLAIAELREKRIVLYDSLQTPIGKDEVFQSVGRFLRMVGFTEECDRIMGDCPQQTNDFDCGMFVIETARRVISGEATLAPLDGATVRSHLLSELDYVVRKERCNEEGKNTKRRKTSEPPLNMEPGSSAMCRRVRRKTSEADTTGTRAEGQAHKTTLSSGKSAMEVDVDSIMGATSISSNEDRNIQFGSELERRQLEYQNLRASGAYSDILNSLAGALIAKLTCCQTRQLDLHAWTTKHRLAVLENDRQATQNRLRLQVATNWLRQNPAITFPSCSEYAAEDPTRSAQLTELQHIVADLTRQHTTKKSEARDLQELADTHGRRMIRDATCSTVLLVINKVFVERNDMLLARLDSILLYGRQNKALAEDLAQLQSQEQARMTLQ